MCFFISHAEHDCPYRLASTHQAYFFSTCEHGGETNILTFFTEFNCFSLPPLSRDSRGLRDFWWNGLRRKSILKNDPQQKNVSGNDTNIKNRHFLKKGIPFLCLSWFFVFPTPPFRFPPLHRIPIPIPTPRFWFIMSLEHAG